MTYFSEARIKKALYAALLILALAAVLYLFIEYISDILIIFLLPFLLAATVRRMLRPFCRTLHISEKLICTAGVLITYILLLVFVFFTLEKVTGEALSLASSLSENGTEIYEKLSDILEDFTDRLPFSGKLFGNGEYALSEFIGFLGGRLCDFLLSLTDGLYRAASSLPELLLAAAALVSSSVYACMGYSIFAPFEKKLPRDILAKWQKIKNRLSDTLYGYLCACSLMTLLSFVELLLGFVILGMDYVFLPALFISFADAVPAIGIGTALIPWSLFLILTGECRKGIGMLILFAVMSVLRQLTEPHIVGAVLGVHPLVMIFSAYSGYRFFGVRGLIVFPVIILVLSAIQNKKE